jgi:hypothetical protein
LRHLRPETFRWQMSNALTWVSAALTDGDTCLDGNVRPDVKKRVTDLARVTSNALYMINRVGNGKFKSRSGSKNWCCFGMFLCVRKREKNMCGTVGCFYLKFVVCESVNGWCNW